MKPIRTGANLRQEISLSTHNPVRGEIWLVTLDPTIGSEIRKTRPAVVVSSDEMGRLPIKLVAPVTDWKAAFVGNAWHIRLDPNLQNGLAKISAVDTLQLRGLDTQRFVKKLGAIEVGMMQRIAAAIAVVVEYQI
jgi:mRNA interferase MazF